jgi:hypothetical protein
MHAYKFAVATRRGRLPHRRRERRRAAGAYLVGKAVATSSYRGAICIYVMVTAAFWGVLMLIVGGSPAAAEQTQILWRKNHSSQVKSVATGMLPAAGPSAPPRPILITGSQFTSDEDIEAIHARTGDLFWSSTALAQWTYAVALQPVVAAAAAAEQKKGGGTTDFNGNSTTTAASRRGVAGFGCPFACPSCPYAPCELGFWADGASASSAPTWKMKIDNSTQSHGPPFVSFSGDGRSLIIKYHGTEAFNGEALEYLAVVSVQSPTGVMQTMLLDWGYGHSVKVIHPPASSLVVAKPQPTQALITRENATDPTQCQHYAMMYDAPGSPIVITDKPLIDCNGTGTCNILAASANLSYILVNVVGGISTLCPAEPTNPWRWGFALLRGTHSPGDSSDHKFPFTGYSTVWHQCSKIGGLRKLTSAHIVEGNNHVADEQRVVATFAHMQAPPSSGAVGVEACAYSTSDSGTLLWCTHVSPITPPAMLSATPSAVGAAGHITLGIPAFGIMFFDGAAETAPTLQIIYDQGSKNDCCVPTALEVVTAIDQRGSTPMDNTTVTTEVTVVASIPRGTVDGIWCKCYGSQLVGVGVQLGPTPAPPAPSPPAPPPPSPSPRLWRCENSQCVAAKTGVTKAECTELCEVYSCQNNQCVVARAGGGTKAECEKMCGPQPSPRTPSPNNTVT